MLSFFQGSRARSEPIHLYQVAYGVSESSRLHMTDAVDEVHADLAIGELDGMFPPYKGYPMPLMVVERTSRDRSGRIQDYTVFYIANFKVGGNTVCHRYVITGMKNGISAVK